MVDKNVSKYPNRYPDVFVACSMIGDVRVWLVDTGRSRHRTYEINVFPKCTKPFGKKGSLNKTQPSHVPKVKCFLPVHIHVCEEIHQHATNTAGHRLGYLLTFLSTILSYLSTLTVFIFWGFAFRSATCCAKSLRNATASSPVTTFGLDISLTKFNSY